MIFAITRPPIVATANAKRPRTIIPSDSFLMIFSGVIWLPTPRERRIETMFISSFSIVLERRSAAWLSFTKFPNASIPIKGQAGGKRRIEITRSKIGNKTFSVFETGLS